MSPYLAEARRAPGSEPNGSNLAELEPESTRRRVRNARL